MLHNQGKQLILCKVPAHIGVKGNEVPNKATKQAIDIPMITTTRLPYTDYILLDHQESYKLQLAKGV